MIDPPRTSLRTKIICTLGPASSDGPTISALCQAGMDVARINMAHSRPEQVRALFRLVRESAEHLDRPVALLADLQGPKIRIGPLAEPVELAAGMRVTLAPTAEGDGGTLPVTYPAFALDVEEGARVLIDDGRVELRVRGRSPPRVEAEVVMGGRVTGGRGINLPGTRLSAPALTEKDLGDLELVMELEVDWLALSFVRSADDVRELRRCAPAGPLIMAKIEKDAALSRLSEVLAAADAVMVARGDLGTELPFEQVPLAQKRIVRSANDLYRPAVIATQMLDSMTERPRPTRAEVSDVANAILDGTDAVLLAAETAVGRYPVEAVQALARVVREIEASGPVWLSRPPYDVAAAAAESKPAATEVAIARATFEAARAVRAPAVVTFTSSGFTARVVSSRRPPVPILAVTDSRRVFRQLALVWGVVPVLCADEASYESMWQVARRQLLDRGLAAPGDRIAITAGLPFHRGGTTNMVRIEQL